MAYRHTLGVAASTLALAVTCLAGAAPASAATTTSFSTTVSIAAERSASGLPSAAEIEEAKKDKDSTNAMIARLEASLASSRAELLQAETAAAEAQESLLTAGEERDLRTADAEKAVKQLEYAKQYLEQSQTDLGAIASDIYRNGAGNSTLGILLNSDDSNDLFYKAATIDTLSQQVQSVNSATEAEALVSAWESYADAAQSAANEAAANYDASASTANSTLAAYQSSIKPEQELRDELISNLASLKDQEEAEVRKQVEEQEEAERETALQETISAEDAPVIKPSQTGTIQPLAVDAPQELEVDQSTAKPTVKPKPEAQPLDTVDTATPTAAPQPESAPKPQKTETPQAEETQAPAETPKAEETPAPKETPKATQKPKETPKATQKPKETPKATQKPKETPKATQKPKETPKATQKPKETPKATQKPKETPKATQKPKPKPEKTEAPKQEQDIAPQGGGRSYGAAISWAMKTASDNSKYYVYGANGPSAFDCSSFSQRAFGQSGISLPRTSTQQFFAAPQYVSLNNLRPGDLVFSSSNGGSSFYHVAIYIGNGQVVHARNPNAGISVTPLSWVNNLHSKAARY
ncbi:NlpC/P60 family protein [Glutamicibacter protophormiae]|uniref:Cell wall-associated NlpC family hydrolase n=1 Tax=Glutamicibacter protophormiae TaxID=37930 RepID=A0ABS4XNP9_GLUPR|nr:NlpC/P60 family protein [Glutamicibacter protophormiae]MBP2398136.1 cell wall-associated NlpC family hydrolase [Glutamicibacter protophormiae]